MVNFGAIDNSARGIWSLTPEGEKLNIRDHKHALKIFDEVYSTHRKTKTKSEVVVDKDETEIFVSEDDTSEDLVSSGDYQSELISILRNMP